LFGQEEKRRLIILLIQYCSVSCCAIDRPLQKWKVENRDDFKGEFRQGQGSRSDSLFIGKIFPTFLTLWIPSKPQLCWCHKHGAGGNGK
jgi:hypothetical protein